VRWWWLMLFACRGCEACRPDIVPVDTGDSDTDTNPVDTDTTVPDTDVPPPCAQPEIEPNGLDAPNPIVMEQYACGTFDPIYDVDARIFEVPRAMWLRVRVDGRSMGRADPILILSAEDGETAQGSARDDGYEDPMLVFPTDAKTWTMMVTDEGGQGGPDNYPYRIMVAEAKAPVEYDATEGETSHSSLEDAEALPLGATVFGDMDSTFESDWYALALPAGKQTLTLTVDAFAVGSAGDFSIALYDADGAQVGTASVGEHGWEHDPWLQYTSGGGETLYARIVEAGGRVGRAYWYTLQASVEDE
jgi:hypothetical protein